MRKILALLLILLVLIAGGFTLLKYSGKIKNIIPFNKPDINIRSETKNISEHRNQQKNIEINADYPEFSGIKDQKISEKINRSILEDYINAEILKYKENVGNCDFSDLAPNPPEWTCELNIAFSGFDLVNNKILSVKMEAYQFSGGAHGGTTYEFLNYNINTGEKISWQNVFKKDSDYLKIISDYSKEDLIRQLLNSEEQMSDSGWIGRGTEPNPDNYNFNVGFGKNGLIIIFQQYQVAAYAAGPQQVNIPYSKLKDVIEL